MAVARRRMPSAVITTPLPVHHSLRGPIIGFAAINEDRPLADWLQQAIDLEFDVTGLLPIRFIAGYFEPLTNGDPVSPELIFAGGDVITVVVP